MSRQILNGLAIQKRFPNRKLNPIISAANNQRNRLFVCISLCVHYAYAHGCVKSQEANGERVSEREIGVITRAHVQGCHVCKFLNQHVLRRLGLFYHGNPVSPTCQSDANGG